MSTVGIDVTKERQELVRMAPCVDPCWDECGLGIYLNKVVDDLDIIAVLACWRLACRSSHWRSCNIVVKLLVRR